MIMPIRDRKRLYMQLKNLTPFLSLGERSSRDGDSILFRIVWLVILKLDR